MNAAKSAAVVAIWASLVRVGARGLLLNAMAFVALALTAWGQVGASVVVAVAVLLLSLAFSGVLNPWGTRVRDQIAGRRTGQALASHALSLTILAINFALIAAANGQSELIGWIGSALFVTLIIVEPVIANLSRAWNPLGANIPWTAAVHSPAIGSVSLYLLNTWSLVLATVALALGLPALALIVVPMLSAVLGTYLAVSARQQVRRNVAFRANLHRDIENFAPRFVLYWEAAHSTSFQVAMWLPFLAQLDERFIVILRNAANLNALQELTDAPIVICQEMAALDAVVVPSIKVAFYVNNSIRNCHFVRYPEITHVQLNHGDSDKAPSFNPVMRMYDKNFVAGQAAIDRFTNHQISVRDDFFTIVGRPQVADVLVRARTGDLGGAGTVLYAPTWAGFMADSNFSSLTVGPRVIDELLARGMNIIFRPHPHARRSPALALACARIAAALEADSAKTGRRHVFGDVAEREMSIFECFNASDYLVSDVSSVVPDYLFSEKPFALIAMRLTPEEFTIANPIATAAYVVDEKLANLTSELDDMLSADSIAEARKRAKDYYLGDFPNETYIDAFLAEAKALLV